MEDLGFPLDSCTELVNHLTTCVNKESLTLDLYARLGASFYIRGNSIFCAVFVELFSSAFYAFWEFHPRGLRTLSQSNYNPRNIFNTDETKLLYNCFPDRTLTFKDDRLTVLLACNPNGSQKLKPLIKDKSAEKRCFKGIKSLPTVFRSNKKSWMTTELFNEWLTSVNSDMKKQKRKSYCFGQLHRA
ncbi:hypothetical protein LAZ67_21000822 [Cordylochernes scorpioides]|uniref:DDE-1 domain-containing protein n=1 Tax=Cordylochernes scorpioides TaxID=51811 RepID=A0ABY6LRD5_9ARAC|nr:hypothetical protein LAZ67_21000822 [Cordylochernes scorpioides]